MQCLLPELRRFGCGAIAAALLIWSGTAAGGTAAARSALRVAHTPNACAGAGMPTNAIVRYYLALGRRQFSAAYACLAPSQQARWPFASWAHGYDHTASTQLLQADSQVPNGEPVRHVAVKFVAVDRHGSMLERRIFYGWWWLDGHRRLSAASLHLLPVSGTPHFNVRQIFARAARAILYHRRADVTGDGVQDDLYVTSGAGCGSCHAQQVWVYSGKRLIFQQEVDDVDIVPRTRSMNVLTDTPGTAGLDSCCPTYRTVEHWVWTPYGFMLRGTTVIHVGR